MAYAMTKQGSLDNCVTYEFICDAIEDMNAIEDRYRTLGSIAIVLSGASGLEVYIAGSDKQWNSLSSIGANSGSGEVIIDGGGFTIHICSSSEVRFGRPNVSTPDEKTIYLIPAEDANSGNLYDEYIYVNNKWEKFGSGGNIDLSDYVTYQDLDNADFATHYDLNNYASLDNHGKVSMEQLPLPTISQDDNGKILKVKNGDWSVENEINISGKVDKKYEVNFEPKTWNGLTNFYGHYAWTDGENIYYSHGSSHYVLDKSTSTWNVKTWNGLNSFFADWIWTDGENIYYSHNAEQYMLDKTTSTWNVKTWNGINNINPNYIWTDGENIYYSSGGSSQYILDKTTSTWNTKTWNGLTDLVGSYIWTDGENIYDSSNVVHYVLDKTTSTWNAKTWNGLTNFSGNNIWTDGNNIYYSSNSLQYVLDKSTSTWIAKTWNELSSVSVSSIWSDGENTYYSDGTDQYILDNKPKILIGVKGEFNLVTSVKDFLGNYAPIENPNFIRSISMGRVTNSVIGTNSTALGIGVTASGSYSHAEGGITNALGGTSHAEGGRTTASGDSSHAEGGGTIASGSYSHAEGGGTTASGDGSHAEGSGTRAIGLGAHAEGGGAQATEMNAHAEGSGTTASGAASHAEGGGASASGDTSHAEGNNTIASGNTAHVEGLLTIAAGSYSHVSGKYNTADSYDNWPEWTANTAYAVDDKVKITSETTVQGYICKTANNDNVFTLSHWIEAQGQMNYAEIIGNGDAVDARSNARALDWDGNEYLMGDIYVGCNADSTGGIKLPRIPEAPSTDGTYTLQVTVANGTPTYSWISAG